MSAKALKWAWDVPIENTAEKLVLITLAWHADERGVTWKKQSTMRVEAGLSRSGFRLKLKELIEAGLITREIRYAPTGRQTTNNYCLNMGGVTMSDPTPGHSELTPPGTPQSDPLIDKQYDTQERKIDLVLPEQQTLRRGTKNHLLEWQSSLLLMDKRNANNELNHHSCFNAFPLGFGYFILIEAFKELPAAIRRSVLCGFPNFGFPILNLNFICRHV